MGSIDYLVIGHMTRDLLPNGRFRMGGTVTYSGRVAAALGCQTAVLTSCGPDVNISAVLPDLAHVTVPASHSTTFENRYSENGRLQILYNQAAPLTAAHIPAEWHDAAIVHLGPVVNEIDPAIMTAFAGRLIGLTPQGWMRRWDENGRVFPRRWEEAAHFLPQATAVVISQEDLLDEAMLAQFRTWSSLLVMTESQNGCTIFTHDQTVQIPAPPVTEIEPTGAGDIFAAAFFIRLHQTGGDYLAAGRFANEIAALSVTQRGIEAKLQPIRAHLHRPASRSKEQINE